MFFIASITLLQNIIIVLIGLFSECLECGSSAIHLSNIYIYFICQANAITVLTIQCVADGFIQSDLQRILGAAQSLISM